jgi:hypothetical protein
VFGGKSQHNSGKVQSQKKEETSGNKMQQFLFIYSAPFITTECTCSGADTAFFVSYASACNFLMISTGLACIVDIPFLRGAY